MRNSRPRQAALTWLVVGFLTAPALAAEPEPQPQLDRLKQHVMTLASPEFAGRAGPGGQKAADYLVAYFKELGLEPLFEGKFEQPIEGREPGEVLGRNVGAKIVGSDPALKDQWVILSAHFDHLGVRNGVLYPGADDNASSVAMMLEAARCLAQGSEKPKRSLMLIGFDLEERGLFGSRYFIEHLPEPQEQIKLFLTADMIGRSLGGVCKPYVFVMGSEHAPALRGWIDQAATDPSLRVGLLGTDLVGTRSDYGPFRNRKIPYLFFSTGENPRYHQPDDLPETLDYPKVEAVSRLVLGVVRQALAADKLPSWTDPPENPLAEAIVVRDVLRILLEHGQELEIGGAQTLLMRNTLRNLDAIIARGTITPQERASVVRVARIVLISVL